MTRRAGWGLLCGAVVLLANCTADDESAPARRSSPPTSGPEPSSSATVDPAQGVATTAGPGPSTPSVPLTAGRCAPDGHDDGGELLLWHAFDGRAEELLEELVGEYNLAEPKFTVRTHKGGNYWELLEQFGSVPADRLPDLMVGNEDSILALVDSGHTVARAECRGGPIPYEDLLPVVEATYTVDDVLVAAPLAVSTPILYFNATAFEEAGLDPSDPPSTLGELRDASDRLVQSGATPYGLVAYDQYGGWLLRQGAAQRGDLLIKPDNGRGFRTGLVAEFNTSANRDAMTWLHDGVDAGSFLWIGGNTGIDDFVRLLDEQQGAAMTIHTSGSLGEVIAVGETGAFGGRKLGVGPLPGPAPGGLVGGTALWVLDRGAPARVAASWSFIDWLLQPDQLARLVAETGYAPPRTSVSSHAVVQEAWTRHPELRVAYDQLAVMPGTPAAAGMLAGPLVDLIPMTNSLATRVVAGEEVDAALADLESQFNTMLTIYEQSS